MGLFEDIENSSSRFPKIRKISDFLDKDPLIIVEEQTDRDFFGGCAIVSLSKIREEGLSKILNKREKRED